MKRVPKPVFFVVALLILAFSFTAIFGIMDGACDLQTALDNAEKNLQRTCQNVARILALTS